MSGRFTTQGDWKRPIDNRDQMSAEVLKRRASERERDRQRERETQRERERKRKNAIERWNGNFNTRDASSRLVGILSSLQYLTLAF